MTDFSGGFAVVGKKTIGRQIWGMWDPDAKKATPIDSVERATILVRRTSLEEVLDADLHLPATARTPEATTARLKQVIRGTADHVKEFLKQMMPIISQAQPKMVPVILKTAEQIFRAKADMNIDAFAAAVNDFVDKLSDSIISVEWGSEEDKQELLALVTKVLAEETKKAVGGISFNPKNFIRGSRGIVETGVPGEEEPQLDPDISTSPVWWDAQPYQHPAPIGLMELLGMKPPADEYFYVEFDPRLEAVSRFVERKATRITKYPNPVIFPVNFQDPTGVRYGFMVFAPFIQTFLDSVRRFVDEHRPTAKGSRRGTAPAFVPDYQVIFPLPRVDVDLRGDSRADRSTMALLEAVAREDIGDPMPITQVEIEGYPPPDRPVSVLELALMPVREFNFPYFRKLAWRKVTATEAPERALSVAEADVFVKMQHVMGGNNVRMMELCFGTSRRAERFKGKAAAGETHEKFPPADAFLTIFAEMRLSIAESADPGGVESRYKSIAHRASGNLAAMREYYTGMSRLIEQKMDRLRKEEIAREAVEVFSRHRGPKRGG